MPALQRGEVWLIDFGLAGKARPALVVSVACGDRDRALITVVPHTTSLRGSPFEIAVRVPFLKPGAFLVQGVTTFPTLRALHRLGILPPPAFEKVIGGLLRLVGTFSRGLTAREPERATPVCAGGIHRYRRQRNHPGRAGRVCLPPPRVNIYLAKLPLLGAMGTA
jgi:mRNA interferase MazF